MNPSSRPPHEHSSTPEFRRLDRTRRVRSFMCRTKGASNVNHHHLPNAPSDSPRSPGLVPYDTTCLPMRPRDEWSNHCDQQTGLRRICLTSAASASEPEENQAPRWIGTRSAAHHSSPTLSALLTPVNRSLPARIDRMRFVGASGPCHPSCESLHTVAMPLELGCTNARRQRPRRCGFAGSFSLLLYPRHKDSFMAIRG